MPIGLQQRTRLVRVFFVLYTLALLTATHWPGLAIKGPFSRTDLIVHACAFGLWTMLLGWSGWVCGSCCYRRRALMVALIGIGFGWFDETTQPMFRRVFDWFDIAANMAGAILAGMVLLVMEHRKNRGLGVNADDSVAQPDADARS